MLQTGFDILANYRFINDFIHIHIFNLYPIKTRVNSINQLNSKLSFTILNWLTCLR
jgi:hypothetical protein